MAEYTLAQCFGPNASQTATQLVISKADLAAVGLTAQAANTGESLIVALLMHWAQVLTEDNRLLNEALRQVAVSSAGVDIVQGSNSNFYRQTLAVSLYQQHTIPSIDPDNY